MRPSILLAGLFVGALLGTLSRDARAGEDDPDDYPLAYAQRPLTLYTQGLQLYLAGDVSRFVSDPNAVKSAPQSLATGLSIQGGAKYGISKALEVEAALAQIQILPKVAYGNPTLGATFRLLNSTLELGVRARISIVTASDSAGIILEPSVPMLVHIGKSMRLDFSAGLPLTVARGQKTMFGLDLPLSLSLNMVDTFHLGVQSNVYIADFSQLSTTLTVPLGFFAGLSIGTDHPILELGPSFTWPKFAQPGATDPGGKINTNVFTAGLAVRGYIFF
ncbi:MAG: hypothetical protein ABJE95_39550 [Byssovorax sp.]